MSMHWIDRLSEYHDGELSRTEQDACQEHLRSCNECSAALQDIQLVTDAARSDENLEPPQDLWPGILERIQPPSDIAQTLPGSPAGHPHVSRIRLAKAPRHISFTLPELALAASLLVAVSAGVSYLAAGRMLVGPAAPAEAPIRAVAEPMMPPSPDVTLANFADAQFDRAVADLERILLEQRDLLDPGTVMVIERNLATIDVAIREARTALDADPANPYLNTHLAEARRRKLDLLRHATALDSAGD